MCPVCVPFSRGVSGGGAQCGTPKKGHMCPFLLLPGGYLRFLLEKSLN